MSKKIALGTDHRGIELKSILIEEINKLGYEPLDMGPNDENVSVDYPDYAKKVTDSVASGDADYGVLICGTGIGMSIAANRNPSIRAALCHNEEDAELTRRHNNSNVLVLGANNITDEVAISCLNVFLTTMFDGGRHEKRVEKLGYVNDISN